MDGEEEQQEKRMRLLKIKEDDLVEKFLVGSGRGGQKLQKTSSCVYLKHLPTGIEIKCQRTRSRSRNRFLAREELCERLEKKAKEKKRESEQRRHAERQRKKGRSKKVKERMLEGKRRRSETKSMRKPPRRNED